MGSHVWGYYRDDEINIKIKYWLDYWKDTCENYFDDDFKTKVSSFHLELLDLINEIEYGKLRYNQYFIENFGRIFKSNPILKEFYNKEIQLMIKSLNQKPAKYLLVLSNFIKKDFEKGNYLNRLCDNLCSILLSDTISDEIFNQIQFLTNEIITEFLIHGLNIDTIKNFPVNIFDKYQYDEKHELVITSFPIDLIGRFEGLDREAINGRTIEIINSLTLADRINTLKLLYSEESNERIFIFEIEGLKGDIEFNIGLVNFYSPKTKKYLHHDERLGEWGGKMEFFHHTDSDQFCNAAISVDYSDVFSGKEKAIEKIEKSLDILRTYLKSEIPFEVNKNSFLVVENGKLRYSSYAAEKTERWYKLHNSLDLKFLEKSDPIWRNFIQNELKYLFEEELRTVPFVNKLIHSIHWYRKGYESNVIEDKLLNYWIVIENLAFKDSIYEKNDGPKKGKEKIVQIGDFISAFEILNYSNRLVWNLYQYLCECTTSLSGFQPKLLLSEDILSNCYLNLEPGAEIKMDKFLETLPILIENVKDEIILEKIVFTHKFYSDNKFAKSILIRKKDDILKHIILLYRYRNFIVHNAHFDKKILSFYIGKAERFSQSLLTEILFDYTRDKTRSQLDILFSKKVRLDIIFQQLDDTKKVELLNQE